MVGWAVLFLFFNLRKQLFDKVKRGLQILGLIFKASNRPCIREGSCVLYVYLTKLCRFCLSQILDFGVVSRKKMQVLDIVGNVLKHMYGNKK